MLFLVIGLWQTTLHSNGNNPTRRMLFFFSKEDKFKFLSFMARLTLCQLLSISPSPPEDKMHFLLWKYPAFKCVSTLLQLKAEKKKKKVGGGGPGWEKNGKAWPALCLEFRLKNGHRPIVRSIATVDLIHGHLWCLSVYLCVSSPSNEAGIESGNGLLEWNLPVNHNPHSYNLNVLLCIGSLCRCFVFFWSVPF